MNSWLKKAVNFFARIFRGKDYNIDSSLPAGVIMGIIFRRIIELGRCLIRGVVFSFDLKKLVFIGKGVVLRNRKNISFGNGVTIGRYCLLDGLSENGIKIGNNVTIGDYTIMEASGTISDMGLGIIIGNNSGIGAFSFVGGAGGVTIGDNVIIGQRVSFHPENHNYDDVKVPIRLQGVNRKGITIENDCWVGANVVFLDGSYVGEGTVVAAGSVVRGSIPPYSVIGGIPCRILKSRQE